MKGPNDNFGTVRSQLILMDPLPDIDRVFALVLQHERKLTSDGIQNVNDPNVSIGSLTDNSTISIQRKHFGSVTKSLYAFIVDYKDIQLKATKAWVYPPEYKPKS